MTHTDYTRNILNIKDYIKNKEQIKFFLLFFNFHII